MVLQCITSAGSSRAGGTEEVVLQLTILFYYTICRGLK